MRNWNHLVPFVYAARELSFRKAASQLGVTPGAISQSISQFERRLGFSLFYRLTREVRLTDEGTRLFEMLRGQVEELDHTLAFASEIPLKPNGTIRLAAYTCFGSQWLVPILADFLILYPAINLDIRFAYDLNDNDTVDIVVRSSLPESSTFEYHEVIKMRSIIVASPAYLARMGTPQTVQELARHTQIFIDNGAGPIPWFHRERAPRSAAKTRLRDNLVRIPRSPNHIVVRGHVDVTDEMQQAGLGLIMVNDHVVKDTIDSGKLVQVLDAEEFHLGNASSNNVYVGCRGPGKMTNRETLLFKHIRDRLLARQSQI
ncbi:LysR family transcriptional regulator [Sphingobium sp. HBC34]|uniref:LysR family transcriptional regulator n=1 Tax=Sphingobium cyanobacteriorum TaxID=3063954 RepID=A0ABT8ZKD6_9SPHN|nr:LysR family transcriptional regulator [Sphingobium sp. HBC34]MDO7835002.1 LysR family transcriptional regulator [Sphingobium sp. HBC34]